MILKDSFIEKINTFMDCASMYEKSIALADVLDAPEDYNVEESQVQDMRDVISFHGERYSNAANVLKEALLDILSNEKSTQMEYLRFEVEVNTDVAKELLYDSFFITFAFSLEARSCDPKNRTQTFLRILEKELTP